MGGILLVAGIIIVLLSIYSLVSLTETVSTKISTKISTKDILRSILNINQTAVKESLRNVGINVGLAFFGVIVSITLIVNGIIALIGGTVILIRDRRSSKHNPISR